MRERTGMVLPDELIADVLAELPDVADAVARTGDMDADDRARFTGALLGRLNGGAIEDPPRDPVGAAQHAAARAGIPVEVPPCSMDVRALEGPTDATVVELAGVLSAANLPQVLARFERVTRAAATVILDLKRVESVDGEALGSLGRIGERVEEAGGRLVLASVPAQVARLLETVGDAVALFLPPVYEDVPAAVRALS
jgi:anti-anti-sigma factor